MATKSLKQQLADTEKLEKEQAKKAQLIRDKIKKEEEAKKPKSILDSIKNFDDILKIAKKKGYKYKPSKDDSKDEAAEKKIKLACLVVNEGWKPTKDVRRWYPYFSLSSGFDFRGSVYDYAAASANGGFRLCLKDEKTADFMGKTFTGLYEIMYISTEY